MEIIFIMNEATCGIWLGYLVYFNFGKLFKETEII